MSALTGKGLVTAGGFNPNTVGASAIFDGSADYLSKTFSSNGDLTEWTLSAWVKRTEFGVRHTIYGDNGGTDQDDLRFESDDTLRFIQVRTSLVTDIRTSAVFRDIGWYHVLVSYESDNATAADRLKMYVNGEEITDFQTSDTVDSARSSTINSTETNYIGAVGAGSLLNGYLAQVTLIDGQSIQNGDYTIDDFGQSFTAGTNGTIWAAKPDASIAALAAAAGGNSYCLTDGIAAGTDASGNGNNFTPTGTPTASENTPSKVYAVINPIQNSAATVSAGSLSWSIGAADGFNTSTLGMTSGKWVCEYTETGSNNVQFGVVSSVAAKRVDLSPTTVTGGAYFYADDGNKYVNGSSSAYGATYTTSDVIRIELDLDTPQVEFFKNGSSQGTISITETDETWFFAGGSNSGSASYSSVFIEGDFAGTPTAGFKALNSANLSAPTYQGADWFNAITYTGDGNTGRGLTGVGFQPDFAWFKTRNAARSHRLTDAVRGIETALYSDTTSAEVTETGGVQSFDTDGVTVDGGNGYNANTETHVLWNWRGDGTSGTTNNDGTITSTVNVAEPGHFSIISYTGTGSAATIGHGLPGTPEFFVTKSRDNAARGWLAYHAGVASDPETDFLRLETTAAAADNSTVWNDTAPTATTITLGTSTEVNSTDKFIMYAFRSVPGVCKVGSYTGNGSADGPYVRLGFKPRWILMADTTAATYKWHIWDTERPGYNPVGGTLWAEKADAENTSAYVDLLFDGFKLRTAGVDLNASGVTYIYLAMADVAGNGILPPIPGR